MATAGSLSACQIVADCPTRFSGSSCSVPNRPINDANNRRVYSDRKVPPEQNPRYRLQCEVWRATVGPSRGAARGEDGKTGKTRRDLCSEREREREMPVPFGRQVVPSRRQNNVPRRCSSVSRLSGSRLRSRGNGGEGLGKFLLLSPPSRGNSITISELPQLHRRHRLPGIRGRCPPASGTH